MEKLKGFNISGTVVPFTSEDTYATHDEEYGRGGYRTVNTISEMNAIPSDRRKEGMLVNVIGGDKYELKNGIFVKVDFGSGGGASSSTPNLDIEIKIERKVGGIYAVFFRIKEKHENGYIFFLRKKRQLYDTAGSGKKRVIKYVISNLYYRRNPGISVATLQPGIWYECPYVTRDMLINKYMKGTAFENGRASTNIVRFKGSVHANPCKYATTDTQSLPNKRTAVLHMALQYNIINTNYMNGIKEDGNIPKPFLQTGKMTKFIGRLRAGTWIEAPDLYLSVE